MTNCEICPIKEECEDAREEIVNESVADMRGYVWGAVDSCPLVEIMRNNFESNVRNLTKLID
jgi:hypothetical protein